MGGRAGGGAGGGMGRASRGSGGGTLASRLNSLFGNGVDMEGIGNIALNGEISEFKVDRDTPTVKHVIYKYKGQESPLAHPSIRPRNPNGWHGLTYAKDSDGWYIDDFS